MIIEDKKGLKRNSLFGNQSGENKIQLKILKNQKLKIEFLKFFIVRVEIILNKD